MCERLICERLVKLLDGALPAGRKAPPASSLGRLQFIAEMTALAFVVNVDDILGKSRIAHLVAARHAAIYVARTLKVATTMSIGRFFKRDHSSVLFAVRKVHGDLSKSVEMQMLILGLMEKCRTAPAVAT